MIYEPPLTYLIWETTPTPEGYYLGRARSEPNPKAYCAKIWRLSSDVYPDWHPPNGYGWGVLVKGMGSERVTSTSTFGEAQLQAEEFYLKLLDRLLEHLPI